jgi:hypothetical protein
VIKIAIIARAKSEHSLYVMLSALCALNCEYLRTTPRVPRLYESGTLYRRETASSRRAHGNPSDCDEWLTIPEIRSVGAGDCEDLAAWRVAELRHDGIAARPQLREVRPGHWHVTVLYPDGTGEDPSRILVDQERARGAQEPP